MRKITKSVVLAVLSALLVFGCKNSVSGGEKDLNDDVPFENGKKDGNDDASLESGKKDEDDDISFESGKYITAKGTADGIKITLSSDLKFKESGGNGITVKRTDNNSPHPFKISITNDNIADGIVEFIFPFTESGKEYAVTVSGTMSKNGGKTYSWHEGTVICTAGGGVDYNEYINIEPIINSVLTVQYNELDAESDDVDSEFTSVPPFTGQLKLDIKSSNDIVKEFSFFKSFTFDYAIVLGEVNWTHTEYWVWCGDDALRLIEDGRMIDLLDKSVYERICNDGINLYSLYVKDRHPTSEKWQEYDYKYAGYMNATLSLRDYPDITFELPTVKSKPQTYTPSN